MNKRQFHDNLCTLVDRHFKMYDHVYIHRIYRDADGLGEIDVIGIRPDAVTIAEVKGRHTRRGYRHALEQLERAYYWALDHYHYVSRINLLYVAEDHVERVKIS